MGTPSIVELRLGAVRRRLRARRRRTEDGFVLLESMLAISLITVIMGALATFTISAMNITNEQRQRQAAAQVATTAMAKLRAIPPTDLTTAATPSTTQVLNNVTYTINTDIDSCVISTGNTACNPTGTGVRHLRAVVAVTWRGKGCPAGVCTYLTTSLVNQDADPVFHLGQASAPDPIVIDPPDQTTSVGAPVSLQLRVQTNTGAAPFTWNVTVGALPTGLTLSASGLITGSPTAVAPSTAITVMVTDAFGHTDSESFNWTILAAPTVTKPNAQTTSRGRTVNLAVAYTCPNGPCTLSMTGAPPGLTINAVNGVITGTASTVGTYSNVVVTIVDSDRSTAKTPAFTWKVIPPGTIASPSPLNATIGSVASRALAYTCPTDNCTLTLSGTMPGLGLSATTPNNTNNVTTTLNVTGPSGTVYIAGTVQANAVTAGATSTGYGPTVQITDGTGTAVTSGPGAWTAFAKPTVSGVGTRTVTVGSTQNVAIPYTCPNASCTFTLADSVPGLGLSTVNGATASNNTTTLTVATTSGTIYINGTVSKIGGLAGLTRDFAVSVTIRDADSSTAVSAGTWTASTQPEVADPGSQAVEPDQNLSLQMSAACPNGGCEWQAEMQVSGDPTWYPLTISSRGLITYDNVPAGSRTIRVTVTDEKGATDTVTFPLAAQTFVLNMPNLSSTRPASGTKVLNFAVSPYMSPPAAGYTYSLSGQPSWLTISADGILTATLTPTSATDTSITLTVTSTASSTSSVASLFSWYLQ